MHAGVVLLPDSHGQLQGNGVFGAIFYVLTCPGNFRGTLRCGSYIAGVMSRLIEASGSSIAAAVRCEFDNGVCTVADLRATQSFVVPGVQTEPRYKKGDLKIALLVVDCKPYT